MSTITNTATVSATQDSESVYATSNEATYTLYAEATELTITKSPTTLDMYPGDTYTITLVITNSDTTEITDAVITDTLDSSLTYVADSAIVGGETTSNVTYSDNVLTISDITVEASGTTTVTFQVTA